MSDPSAKFTKQSQSARMLRMFAGLLLLSSIFAGGVFLSRAFDRRVVALVSDARSHLKTKYGISTAIGQVETGFGTLNLSEVSIGEPAWMVVTKVDISVSFNPFNNFLRPNSVTLGRAMVKVPWKSELWPKEVKHIVDAMKRRTNSEYSGSESSPVGGLGLLIPTQFIVNAARIELADGDVTKFLTENLRLNVDIRAKHMDFGTQKLQILDFINEDFVEGNIKLNGPKGVSSEIRGRLSQSSEPLWNMACESQRDLLNLSCNVASKHLPNSFVKPLQRYVGVGFSPSFYGSIIVKRGDGGDTAGSYQVNVDGKIGDVFIENPTLSVGVVGPIAMNVKIQSEMNRDLKSVKIFPSLIELGSVDAGKSKDSADVLSIQMRGEINAQSLAKGDQILPTGFVDVTIPATPCQTLLNSLPKSLASELVGIGIGGTANLELAANVVGGIPEIKIKNSSFDCNALSVPEIYSATYLNGPFNIERNLPEGKIYIPVDPARPYFAAYNDIPHLVRSAFVSSEDAGFFQHKGVEVSAIVGAVERNTEEGRAAVGGSTITMQTVKNLFLARDKTISRKVQEIFLAWHLERTISKERILEIYLNMVEFGPDLYGIGMASQRFFGKAPKDLTLKQAI